MNQRQFSYFYFLKPASADRSEDSKSALWIIAKAEGAPLADKGAVLGLKADVVIALPPVLEPGVPVEVSITGLFGLKTSTTKVHSQSVTYVGVPDLNEKGELHFIVAASMKKAQDSIPPQSDGLLSKIFAPDPVPETLTILLTNMKAFRDTPFRINQGSISG